jgi:hypothetical protein
MSRVLSFPLLAVELETVRRCCPGAELSDLVAEGLRHLSDDLPDRVPETRSDGSDLDELCLLVAREATSLALLRQMRAEARRQDHAAAHDRDRLDAEYPELDRRMTELESRRDRLLAEITHLEDQLRGAGMDPARLLPPVAKPPGAVRGPEQKGPDVRRVFGNLPQERPGTIERLIRRFRGG